MDSIKKKLLTHGQDHLLKFWDELSNEQRHQLENDINELDLAEVTAYYTKAIAASACIGRSMLDDIVQPVPEENVGSAADISADHTTAYRKLGLQEVANGRVAVLLMAGGQGTRLGVTYPKGLYDVGLQSHSTLFEIQAKRILKLEELAEKEYGKRGEITWYVMTSEATHEDTLAYIYQYGVKENNIKVFKQGMLPCFTLDGKIILDKKYKISKAPDGNGGLYRALKVQGILNDMRQRGIRSVHAHSVDNILIKVADPVFIGYCLSTETDCGVKVIEKTDPHEPVGVVCKVADRYRVVEYSEISKETAELRRSDGHLVYNAANICNHYFTVDFLCDIGNLYEGELQLHAAKKKIPYIDEEGNRCTPKTPNGIKIEKFVFDVFQFAKNFSVWRGVREEEFSPVKNSDAAGSDCPDTARRDLLRLHKKWLLDAGAEEVVGDVEISPSLSYAGENLKFAKGKPFHGPTILR